MKKVVVLCPTYGRTPGLLANSLACFQAQDYIGPMVMVLYDDLGNIRCELPENVILLQTRQRAQSISYKYPPMIGAVPDADVFVWWDDDDVYLPWHVKASVAACGKRNWSHPRQVWSTYGSQDAQAHREETGGRFWASMAVTASFLSHVGGIVLTRRADFDQQMLIRLKGYSPPGRADNHSPSYVYRWGSTNEGHVSGLMKSPDNEDWWDRYEPRHTDIIRDLPIQFDGETRLLYERLPDLPQ